MRMTNTAVIEPPQIDIYSHQRAGIIERLQAMHGRSTYREPQLAHGTRAARVDTVPWEHTLAAACVWLRGHEVGRPDVSADLLWCMVMDDHCDTEATAVRRALVAAWMDLHGSVATLARTPAGREQIRRAARRLVYQCVTGREPRRKLPVHWQLWRKMQDSGERMLWALADRACRRAESALVGSDA